MIGTSITKELKVFKIVSEALQRDMKKKNYFNSFHVNGFFLYPLENIRKPEVNLSRPNPIPIPDEEKKDNLNFYFQTSLSCPKRHHKEV